jgi:hypothetical protein
MDEGTPHHLGRRPRSHVVIASAASAAVLLGTVVAWAAAREGGMSPAAAAESTASQVPSAAGVATAVPSTTPTPTRAAMFPASTATLVLGDSLGLDVYPWLADLLPDRYVSYEAKVGRSTRNTAKAVRAMPSIPSVVLVSSGTNDQFASDTESSARDILDALGPQRCVVWIDVVRPDRVGDPQPEVNAAIDRAVAGRPNVSVLRWSEMVAANPAWLTHDGIHPDGEGAQARAQAMALAARSCSPLDPAAPRAARQVLPPSAFTGPISGGGSGSGSARTTPSPTHTSHSATPSPTPTTRTATPASTTPTAATPTPTPTAPLDPTPADQPTAQAVVITAKD